MPVRFRCPHCTRLLGIARRKAGTQINCPQCAGALTVPMQDDSMNLEEIDVLLRSEPVTNGLSSAPPVPRPEPPRPAPPRPLPVPQPVEPPLVQEAPVRPSPKPPEPRPQPQPQAQPPRKPAPFRDAPLLEKDVDSLLGLKKPGSKFDLDDQPAQKSRPVSGMDAMSLGDEPRGIVLSPQKATLLVVAMVVLLGIAFAAGFLIASNI